MEDVFNDALKNRTEEIIDYLRYNDVNILDESGKNLLHYACLGAANEVIHLLLKNKININQVANNGETPIFSAVRNRLIGITSLLINNGADLSVKNLMGESLLHLAVYGGQENLLNILLSSYDFDLDSKNINNENILFYAIKGHKENMFFYFTNIKPSLIFDRDYHNMNLLQAAIKYNNYNIYEYLKDKINIYNCDKENNNAIMYVARYADADIAADFLNLNPIIEGKNKSGQNVFELTYQNKYDIKYLFEQYKITYKYISYLKTYPIHVAILNRDYMILEKYSYDKNKKDIYGVPIIELAINVGDQNILDILNKH